MKSILTTAIGVFLLILSLSAEAVFFHTTNGSIDGSLCIGFDCIETESFGFDTLKIKENNLRILFDDTSNSASFPQNDWRILINDSTNGGAAYFAVEDSTAARVPFKIEAGAIANALYVDSQGDIGIGTSTPVVELHAVDGNTPTLRLEQNGSSGFTPQTWDIAGNETNFFIRDVTNGSTLPFRIRPNAPTDSLEILANGDVGMGIVSTTSQASLHVRRTDGTAKVFVEETNAALVDRVLFKLSSVSNPKFSVENTGAGVDWAFANPGTGFRLSRQGSGVVEMEVFNNGNMLLAGALTQNSDINAKTAITGVDTSEILNLVTRLPMNKWEYKDARGEAHIGPMAQDFYAAFGLGATDTGISSIDTAGVALAAIQALAEKSDLLETKNLSLQASIVQLQRENQTLLSNQQKQATAYTNLKAMVLDLQMQSQSKSLLTSLD